MTRAGILYACRSLAMSHISTTNANLNPLKGDISNIIAELAFRQWLGGCGIQYQLIHAAPFSQPHIDEVLLNGRRCHLTNYPLSQIGKNDPIKRNLAGLLSAPACLAETTMNSDHLGPNDLLFFSFMSVQPDLSREEQRQTATTGSGNFFIYILPRRWLSQPTRASWRLSNASPVHFDVEVGGVSLERTFMSRTIHLLPHETAEIDPKFSRVVFLSMSQVPIGAISIQRGLRTPFKSPQIVGGICGSRFRLSPWLDASRLENSGAKPSAVTVHSHPGIGYLCPHAAMHCQSAS